VFSAENLHTLLDVPDGRVGGMHQIFPVMRSD